MDVMPLNKAPLGTVLTADVTVTETPVIDRTVTTLKGKVWVSAPTSVILTLENGENKQYDVPPDSCSMWTDRSSRRCNCVRHESHGDQIVESPRTEITTDAVVTGVGPKKK